jgi:hypothetical protein
MIEQLIYVDMTLSVHAWPYFLTTPNHFCGNNPMMCYTSVGCAAHVVTREPFMFEGGCATLAKQWLRDQGLKLFEATYP